MKINISIDDVCPHPGVPLEVLARCEELLSGFPEVKFTLFVPLAYWRTVSQTTVGPLRISEYPEFCQRLLNLDPEHFELGYHGYFHGIPRVSNNDEMMSLSYDHMTILLEKMRDEAGRSGLLDRFDRGSCLRPPAWRISEEAIQACSDSGLRTLALHPDSKYLEVYGKGLDRFSGNVVWCNVNPPFKPLLSYNQTEITYHAIEWDKNFLSAEAIAELRDFLVRHREESEFCFMSEMV